MHKGVYTDDHIVVAVVEKDSAKSDAVARDVFLRQQSCAAYDRLGHPRSEAKAFDEQEDFAAWGT